VEARPAVFLDNFNAKELKSDTLASALTESPAMVRPMGHTKTVPLHTRTFIAITGNGVQIAEDMARRKLMVRLDAQMEDPEARPFAPGFLEQVSASRSALLSDALTIWRYGRQTVLKPGKPIGSFEKWAQWCRDPLLMLGCRDPIERIADQGQRSTAKGLGRVLRYLVGSAREQRRQGNRRRL
jgi:putative DNA primase/helicase